MNPEEITADISETFAGVDVVEAAGNRFYFANPGGDDASGHRFPFATLVTSDEYDTASNLSRPGVHRLNIGVGKETYRSLFGAASDAVTDGARGRLRLHGLGSGHAAPGLRPDVLGLCAEPQPRDLRFG